MNNPQSYNPIHYNSLHRTLPSQIKELCYAKQSQSFLHFCQVLVLNINFEHLFKVVITCELSLLCCVWWQEWWIWKWSWRKTRTQSQGRMRRTGEHDVTDVTVTDVLVMMSRGMLSGLVSSGDWHRSGHCGNTWPGARTCALTMSGHWRDQDTHSVNILCNISIVNTIIRSDRLSTMIGTTVFRLLSVQWRGHDYFCSWHMRDLKVYFFYQCSLIKETLKEHL